MILGEAVVVVGAVVVDKSIYKFLNYQSLITYEFV